MSARVKKIGNDSTNQITVSLDITKLDQIEKELNKHFIAQVGVLGVKAGGRLNIKEEKVGGKTGNRKAPIVQGESGMSNADIGLIHEKGSMKRNIPRRSFLEVPLTTKLPLVMNKIGASLLAGLSDGNIEMAYKKLASIAEGIVLRAFPTQGYGMWKNKVDGKPSRLIDTGQLRQSISSRVVSK